MVNVNHLQKRTRLLTVFSLIALLMLLAGCSAGNDARQTTESDELNETEPNRSDRGEGPLADEETRTNGGTQPESSPAAFSGEPALPHAVLVSIGNNPDARPQAGLSRADRVYEMSLAGDITRYLAVFYHQPAEKIGPVRSARSLMLKITKPFQAPLAHAGGGFDALALIPEMGIQDMDEIYGEGAYFWRGTDRRPPNNLYTSTAEQLRGARDNGYDSQPLEPLPAGDPGSGPAAESLVIEYADHDWMHYDTGYRWTGTHYVKQVNGEPYQTLGGQTVVAQNVIVIEVPRRVVQKEELTVEMDIVGEGEALYFTRGQVFEGSWKKETANQHYQYLRNGEPMLFQRGITWVNLVPDLDMVSYDTEIS